MGVSSTSLITVARNRYSMPCVYVSHPVSVRPYPERLVVVADQGRARRNRVVPVAVGWRLARSVELDEI